MKKFKKLISTLLCLMMVLSSIPTAAFATPAITKDNTAVLHLDYLGSSRGSAGTPGNSAQAMPDYDSLAVGDVLWFGVSVTNMTKTTWPALNGYGIGEITVAVNYDESVLTPFAGSDFGGKTAAAKFTNAATKFTLDADNGNSATAWDSADCYKLSSQIDRPLSTLKNETSNLDAAKAKMLKFNIGIPLESAAGMLEFQRFLDNEDAAAQYLVRFPMTLASKPDASGKNVIELDLSGDGFVACIFDNAGKQDGNLSIQWDAAETIKASTNAKTYFSYAGDPNLFPVQEAKPALNGTVAITGTATAGETLTADISNLKADTAALTSEQEGNLTYKWSAGGTEISGATGKTFELTGAQIGKTITVTVTPGNKFDATSTAKTSDATAAVAAAALPAAMTLNNATPTFGDELTVTGLPTGWTLNWYYGDTAAAAEGATNKYTSSAKANLILEVAGGAYISAVATPAAGSIYGPDAKLTATTTAAVAKKALTDPDTPTLSTKVGVTSITGGNATPKGGVTGTGAYAAPQVAYTVSNVQGVDTAGTPGTADVTFAAIPDTNKCYTYAGNTVNNVPVTVTDKTVTGVTVESQPTKLTYTAGQALDLTGLTVKVTYDNGTDETVAAADFATKGITASPANGTVTTTAMSGNPVTITVGGQTATTGNLTVEEGTTTATGIAIKTQPTKTEYKDGEALDLTGLEVTVTWNDGVSDTTEDVALADFAAKGITTEPANGTKLTVAENGTKVTVKLNALTAETDALTVTKDKINPVVAWDKISQRLGKVEQVTAKVGNYDLTDLIEYELPATTTPGTPAVDPVACEVEGCVHADGSECTATPAVDEVPCDKTVDVSCNHTKGDAGCAADCPIVAAIDAGTYTDIAGAEAGGVTCDKTVTVACNHNDVKAADCTYVAAKAAVACTTPGCVHTDKAACTAKAGTPAGADTTTPARWVKWADEEEAIKALPVGTYNLRIDYTAVNALTGFTDDYNAMTENPVNTLTIKKKSSGGGGGGGAAVSEYTVRFDADKNGEFAKDAKTSVKVEVDKTVAKADIPAVTAKEGFKFIGWTLDGKTVVDPTEEKVTGSVTYTALYKEVGDIHTAYMKGNEKGQFMPDAKITRAEAAALFARLIPGYDENATYTGKLADVVGNEWFANEVLFDVEKGYITGYKDGTFLPKNAITRQEFCTIVAKYLGYENEGTTSFADCKGVFAEGYIAQLIKNGYVAGYEDGTFRPDANITRAEATKILNAVFDRVPDKAAIDEAIENYEVNLIDVAKRHWAYYEILEAAIEHDAADFHTTK